MYSTNNLGVDSSEPTYTSRALINVPCEPTLLARRPFETFNTVAPTSLAAMTAHG